MQIKQVWAGALFVLICQLMTGVSAASEQQKKAEVLRISTGDFSPWSDKASPHSGFVNRVIKEAFRREGYEVQFLYWPWKRSLETARVGKVDATSFWYFSEEKAEDFIYSDPISEHKEVFFYLKKNPMKEWNDLTDLMGLKVGATRSFTYTDEFWALAKDGKLNVLEANSDELNFKKLIAGRTDLFPAAEVVGWQVLTKLKAEPREMLATLKKPLAEQEGHLLFPKKTARSLALSEAFNRALKSMRDDGTFEQYRDELMAGQY